MNSYVTPLSVTQRHSLTLPGWTLALGSCGDPTPAEQTDPAGQLTLHLHATIDGEALRLDGTRYPNPGGTGTFELHDARFYLSHLVVSGPTGTITEPDSVHLVRFSEPSHPYVLSLPVSPGRYDRIDLAIGVDAEANTRLDHVGDLDPNGQMAWSWRTGYKFLLLEGEVHPAPGDEATSAPLVYHVGFSESYRPLTCPLPVAVDVPAGGAITVDLDVDLAEAFHDPHRIDLRRLPSVKLDPRDAALVADNYADMITVRGSAGADPQRCTAAVPAKAP